MTQSSVVERCSLPENDGNGLFMGINWLFKGVNTSFIGVNTSCKGINYRLFKVVNRLFAVVERCMNGAWNRNKQSKGNQMININQLNKARGTK